MNSKGVVVNYIDRVVIKCFWGEYNLNFNFDRDVNFIIGSNGSGKTTAVNIIVAALNVNTSVLDRMEFDEIEIFLKSKKRVKPYISVCRIQSENESYFEYLIKESATGQAKTWILNSASRDFYVTKFPDGSIRRKSDHGRVDVLRAIRPLINISWLPVGRGEKNRGSSDIFYEDNRDVTPVDFKLKELSDRFVRFFSTLSKAASEPLEDFQKQVFLSMLYVVSESKALSNFKHIDLEKEEDILKGIFSQFKVMPRDFEDRIHKHFDSVKKSRNKLLDGKALSMTDMSALVSTDRIDYIVDRWNDSSYKRDEISKPKNTFIDILNSMMDNKIFSINSQNELQVTTFSGKDLSLNQLSSGEKQLIIILGEALLQENKPCTYFADEPELSLHVIWQESLVKNLKMMNPNAQIVFATHSPDIVSIYGENIHDMKEIMA